MNRIVAIVLIAGAAALAGCNTTGSSSAESEGVDVETTATADVGASEGASERTVTGLDEDAVTAVTEAAANTTEAGTSRFELFIETEGTGAGDGTQPVTVQGEEDFEDRLRELTFVGPDGDLAVIVDDTDVYVEVPATEDEDWARIELDALTEDSVGFGGPAGLPFQSPQDNIAVLGDAITAAAEGDIEDVRGTQSTRYDLVVDLEAAAEQAADDANETFDAVVEQSGLTELDMQVWVDDEERVSRVSYTLDLAQADIEEAASEIASEVASEEVGDVDVEATGAVTVTVEYFDYGIPLDIEIPAEEDVVDIDEDEIRDSFAP